VYQREFQRFIEANIEVSKDDAAINILQISYIQILKFIEKILETELYIMEGTGYGFNNYSSNDQNNSS
jgi:hypothetical protein